MIRKTSCLIRPGVSLAVGFSALAGYVLAAGGLDGPGGVGGGLDAVPGGVPVFAGTFALSAAVSVLNQIQERRRDALMERTRERPLASGRMSPEQGRRVFAALLLVSALCLWPALGWGAGLVLVVVLGLYNGVYTPLKPVTAWAMIPGAACGALPPWIGWVAGGGGALALTPVYLFALYFVWQMPHFWMLAETNAEDYAARGLPGAGQQLLPLLAARHPAPVGPGPGRPGRHGPALRPAHPPGRRLRPGHGMPGLRRTGPFRPCQSAAPGLGRLPGRRDSAHDRLTAWAGHR